MTALDDLRRYPITSQPHTTAVRWLLGDDERWPFAFRPACTELGLDAAAVRKRVVALLAAQRTVPAVPARVPCGRAPAFLVGAA